VAIDETYPKAYVDGYDPEPFWFEETFGNDGETRLVVYTQDLDQLKWLVETVISASGELVDVMLKVQEPNDNGTPAWRRWMGRTDRKTVEDTFEKFSEYFLQDGGHQFLVRDAKVGVYFALDEHGVLYLYGGWQRFEDKLGEMGFENREDELITAQGHWHIELADTKSLRECVIHDLGLVER
jgi:hypothetical protein